MERKILKTSLDELEMRMKRFRGKMDEKNPGWKLAIVFSKVNQFYFTGTMQDGMLTIPRDDRPTLWVRRSIERALDESLFESIRPMVSFRDAAEFFKSIPDTVHIETGVVPIALYERLRKYFPFKHVKSLDREIASLRAVKSPYERALMKKSGEVHKRILEDRLPGMLEEGMSEAELASRLYPVMVEEGHHGVNRLSMFNTEIAIGHVAFGESSIYPTYFNGPGGNYGMSPAVPLLGSRERRLKKGDLVFVDIACGVDGYHTDKTMTYMFGGPVPGHAMEAHRWCVEIQNEIAGMLRPGSIPSEIYRKAIGGIDKQFLENFMGFGERKVRFLGHGIGLEVDELPVIAEGFDEPLQEGMAFAVEPKKGINGVGMVGTENTYLVTHKGGERITGDNPGLIPVL